MNNIYFTKMTRVEAINHPECPDKIKSRLELLELKFYSFDGKIQNGQLVMDKDLAPDIKDLFAMMLELKFPLERMEPIVAYDWDDEASMSANNTSAFNYRKIAGQDKLSLHSYGFAIDLNPRMNPVMQNGAILQPKNGSYDISVAGTLFAGHPVVEFMKARNWNWGGDWTHYQDYQHFDKKVYETI